MTKLGSNKQQQKQMSDEECENVLSMSLHRRRFSLFENKHQNIEKNHREVIKSKYQQFMKSKRNALQDRPYSPEASSFGKTQTTDRSMPSIRVIREQRHLIGQSLRKTISRYNYVNHQKEKKLQALNRKKMKYQNIMKVREEHSQLKKRLSESLVSLNKQVIEEKLKLKHSVDMNRILASHSRIQLENQKRSKGRERRQEIFESKAKIKQNKSTQFEACKKLHEGILAEERQLKAKKKMMQQHQKKVGVKYYYEKLHNQINKFVEIDKAETTTKSKLSPQVTDLQRSKQIIDEKLKNYEKILKDGTTLKKNKIHIKIKNTQTEQREPSRSRQLNESEQDSLY